MIRLRRARIVFACCAAVGAAVGAAALVGAPAGATTNGKCTAAATFSDGHTVDADQDTAKIPKRDTVNWRGSMSVPAGQEMAYAGHISIKLPVGSYEIRSWSGTTKKNASGGTDSYDIPKAIPGMKGTVSGSHTQAGVTCSGSMEVEIEGGAGVAGAVSVGGTAATGGLLALAARARKP